VGGGVGVMRVWLGGGHGYGGGAREEEVWQQIRKVLYNTSK